MFEALSITIEAWLEFWILHAASDYTIAHGTTEVRHGESVM